MTHETPSAILTLEEAAQYLSSCRARKLTTGDWSFEAHKGPDRSGELRAFFEKNPQHRISINRAARFLSFSDRSLERLNEQLPEQLQVKPANPVMIADKFR